MPVLLDGEIHHGEIFRLVCRSEDADIRDVAVNCVDVDSEVRDVCQRVESRIVQDDRNRVFVYSGVLCHLVVGSL